MQRDQCFENVNRPQNLNQYIYVENCSTTAIDPTGKSWFTAAGIVIGWVGFGIGTIVGSCIGGAAGAYYGAIIGATIGGAIGAGLIAWDRGASPVLIGAAAIVGGVYGGVSTMTGVSVFRNPKILVTVALILLMEKKAE